MEENLNTGVANSLQIQMKSLQKRILELETENAELSARLSKCVCKKIIEGNKSPIEDTESQKYDENGVKNISKKMPDKSCSNTMALHHLPKRCIALKVMYFGQRELRILSLADAIYAKILELQSNRTYVSRYLVQIGFYGFASEGQMDPTVESEIFKALEKTRLISGDKKELQYSRCGRTDKGVSSVGQVISLFLRTNLKEAAINGYSGEIFSEESCGAEIDYVKLLNRVLPKDIRIMGWSPAPIDFSARFSCLSREYKYFFWIENLDIDVMRTAGNKFIGQHDFRNFCKMDAANVHNYRRCITSFDIFPCNERFEDDELWAVKIKGSAFLWHQIRCMVAVLFLIGQRLESPNVIDELLDVETTPRKPQYIMAPEIPLVLHSCEFEGLKFMCSSDANQALHTHLEKECRSYKLQAAIFNEALLSSSCALYVNNQLNSRKTKKESAHVPLISRPTEPSYEERRAKLNAGGGIKKTPVFDTSLST